MLTNPLPSKHELLRACRAEPEGDHVLLNHAHALTVLHERRLGANGDIDEIDGERTRLVHEIDCWVISRLPPSHGGASLHTETVGAVVDRLAQYTACAYAALANAGDWNLFDAWERLAELAVGYEDLANDVSSGRRRLPGGP
ncbi:DUF4254 domain-containing protein [Nocardia transvalensis]|uniref:DUF4254 domain-containing protein n=1 Tax=Nocardia transvalensis TaxID=37333 RepID=UPI001895E824|nr:DUF4254 domain-containing protein [Nocardia transvalensis]MBF6329863.1 DUF4254 domain-containing protein [Nocardia transvalensis]